MFCTFINLIHFRYCLSTIVEDVCKKEYLSQGKVRSGNLTHRSPLKATEDMKNIENMHKKRIERVHSVCEKYKKSRHGYLPRPTFLFDVNNGLAWCHVPKVIKKTRTPNILIPENTIPGSNCIYF